MSATAATQAKPVNTIQAVNRALDEALALDPNVILLGEDIADEEDGGVVGVTKGLSSKYGRSRVRTTPISEQAIIGAAIGAAIVGFRPVALIEERLDYLRKCVDFGAAIDARLVTFHMGFLPADPADEAYRAMLAAVTDPTSKKILEQYKLPAATSESVPLGPAPKPKYARPLALPASLSQTEILSPCLTWTAGSLR